MKDRRTARCTNCRETFSYLIDLPDITPPAKEPYLLVKLSCPFCKAKLQIDLSPYRRTLLEIYRTEAGQAESGEHLELPDELPTRLDD